MENTKDLLALLAAMGCKKHFKPYMETESKTILLQTRKPPQIIDGVMSGAEIDIYDNSTFRIWTSQTKKARAAAARYGLRLRLMDGESELFIPAILADELLPKFGAKVKRIVSEATKAKIKANWFKKDTA